MKLRRLAVLGPSLLLCACLTSMIDRITGEDQAKAIRATGKSARARVLQIWDTGMTLNSNPVVRFRLEVFGEGIEPFVAETRAVVGRLDVPQIQPGAEVEVKYDPNDHQRVALVYTNRK